MFCLTKGISSSLYSSEIPAGCRFNEEIKEVECPKKTTEADVIISHYVDYIEQDDVIDERLSLNELVSEFSSIKGISEIEVMELLGVNRM